MEEKPRNHLGIDTLAVTGARGFIGREFVHRARRQGINTLALSRSGNPNGLSSHVAVRHMGPDAQSIRSSAFKGVDAVVHLAGLAHDRDATNLDVHRRANRDFAVAALRAAASSGVSRFVFVSSVAVYGRRTTSTPLTEFDETKPVTSYGRAKCEAEDALRSAADRDGIELVVVRPTLVCGAGAPGNLARLAQAIARGVPLPLGSIDNRRSMIAVEDLAELLCQAVRVPAAAGHTILAADPHPVSTPHMVRDIAAGMNRAPRLLPCPEPVLRAAGLLAGKSALIDQVAGSLEFDSSRARSVLQWEPQLGVHSGLRALGRTFT